MMKRCLGSVLAVIMLFSVLPVSASEQEKDEIDTNIYQVELPMNTKGTFDFILDPQGLINKTDAAAYDGKKFESGSTVFFRRTDGKVKEDYSSTSDSVTIVNKSSISVDVSLDIKVDDSFTDKIKLTDDKKFKGDRDASLYLALKDKDHVIPIKKNGLSLDFSIAAAPDGAYGYSYDKKNEEYTYKLKKDLSDIKFNEYSFRLTGAANGKGDWSKLTDVTPKIKVEWKVSPGKEVERKDAILEEDMILGEIRKTEEAEQKGETEQKEEAEQKREVEQTEEAEQKEGTEQKDGVKQEEGTEQKDGVTQEEVQDNMKEGEEKLEIKNKAPSIEKRTYTLSVGDPISIETDMGSGDMAATQVVSVRWKDSDEELLNVSDEVVYKNGKILFSKEWVDKCIEDKEKWPESLLIIFDDTDSTEVEIVLKE